MTAEDRMAAAWRTILYALVVMVVCIAGLAYALAHDHDRPELHAWYGSLMQPDAPLTSCCGLSDAYWCDDYYARDGKAYCKITDDRDDAPLRRPHVPIGTEIEIPPHKLKWEQNGKPVGNPTGHAVVFLSVMGHVFCYVQAGGV
jgi:hypothetical protein